MFLGLRGFSLAEIGLAEGFFHLVSILGELPSGLAADLLGRKRVLAASQGLFGLFLWQPDRIWSTEAEMFWSHCWREWPLRWAGRYVTFWMEPFPWRD